MKMTNKLTLHHKGKFGLVLKNLSIAFGSFSFVITALVLPTYISIAGDKKVPTQAEQEILNEDPVEEEEQNKQNEVVEDEGLLQYEQE